MSSLSVDQGDQWRVMDDSERTTWEQIAEDDRKRYNDEMKAYGITHYSQHPRHFTGIA